MNKKIFVISICIVILATIPIAAGIQPTTNTEPTGPFARTVVRGYILGHRTEGRTTSFFALYVHYTIYRLFHQPESGFFILQSVQFAGRFDGHASMFYINGIVHGIPL